jgi:hypothetical protein
MLLPEPMSRTVSALGCLAAATAIAIGCGDAVSNGGNEPDFVATDAGGGGVDGAVDNGGGGGGDAAAPSPDSGLVVIDGGVALPDGATQPTGCTLGAAGALALVPVETMAPGTACVACHLGIGKPIYIAGTVYPALHDADLCLGVTGVSVEIVDNSGAAHQLPVNTSGNFLDQSLLELWPSPWTVAVVRGAARRPMIATVTNGDCNACHTAPGANGAPGRILAPDDAGTGP